MLAKYASPLPEGWKEKYDPGTGRHFYWCTRTDRVSWLPPGHPKAKVGNIELNNSIHLEARIPLEKPQYYFLLNILGD